MPSPSPTTYDLILVGGLGPTGSSFLSTILTSKTPPKKICVICEGDSPTKNNNTDMTSKNIASWAASAHHSPQTSQVHLQETKIGIAQPYHSLSINLIEAPRPIQVFPTKNRDWSGGNNASLYFGPTVSTEFDAKSRLFKNVISNTSKPFNSSTNVSPEYVQVYDSKLTPEDDDEHSYSSNFTSNYPVTMDVTKSFYGDSEFIKRISYFDAMLKNVILPTNDTNVFTVKKNADCVITVKWSGDKGVEKVVFDKASKATGIQCSNKTKIFLNANSKSEIILSCGSINSPSILLRSLDKNHIIYPHIGKGLRDHCALPRLFISPFKSIFPSNIFANKNRVGNGVVGFWFSNAEEKLNCAAPNKAHDTPIPAGTHVQLMRGSSCLSTIDVLAPRFLRRRYKYSEDEGVRLSEGMITNSKSSKHFDVLKMSCAVGGVLVWSYLLDVVFKVLYFCLRSVLTVVRLVLGGRRVKDWFDDHVCGVIICLLRTSSTGEISILGETGETVITMPFLSHKSERKLIDEAYMASTIVKDDMVRDSLGGRKNVPDLSSATEVVPGGLFSYETHLSGFLTSYYHLHGSNAEVIGLGDCKVKGCERLRVCDSSCFPFTVEAPLVRACAELGREVGRVYLLERTGGGRGGESSEA